MHVTSPCSHINITRCLGMCRGMPNMYAVLLLLMHMRYVGECDMCVMLLMVMVITLHDDMHPCTACINTSHKSDDHHAQTVPTYVHSGTNSGGAIGVIVIGIMLGPCHGCSIGVIVIVIVMNDEHVDSMSWQWGKQNVPCQCMQPHATPCSPCSPCMTHIQT